MNPTAKIRPATIEDAHEVAPLLRLADRREVQALGTTPIMALAAGVNMTDAYSVVWSDQVVAIFGISPHPACKEYGLVWLLGTPEIEKIRSQFLRHSKEVLAVLSQGYRFVGNVVDSRNTLHMRWLNWLGFEFGSAVTFNDTQFLEFCKQVDHV